jgi:hypothetical protein
MAKKADLIAKAEEMGIDVDENATVAEIQSLIDDFTEDEGEDDEGSETASAGASEPARKEGNPTDLGNLPKDVKVPETAKPKAAVAAKDGRKLAGRYELISKAHVRGMMLPVGTELALGEEDARRLLAQGAVKPCSV